MKVGQPYKLVFPSPSKSQFPSTHLLSKACSFNACVYSEQNLNSLEPDRQPCWLPSVCFPLSLPLALSSEEGSAEANGAPGHTEVLCAACVGDCGST